MEIHQKGREICAGTGVSARLFFILVMFSSMKRTGSVYNSECERVCNEEEDLALLQPIGTNVDDLGVSSDFHRTIIMEMKII